MKLVVKLLLVAVALVLAATPHLTPASASTATTVFETFQGLAGQWRGKSTKGWDEVTGIKAIAGGSVVVFNSFDAHPGEEMLTAIHMDGERLVLTHYCIAKNQPRLAATSMDASGKKVTFTFQDGTNLPSRDHGHMDKVIYNFHGPDHFSSKWTWYQDGEEQWMEEVHYHRLPDEVDGPTGSSPGRADAGAPPR